MREEGLANVLVKPEVKPQQPTKLDQLRKVIGELLGEPELVIGGKERKEATDAIAYPEDVKPKE